MNFRPIDEIYKINVLNIDKNVARDQHIVSLIWLKDLLDPISVDCTVESDEPVDR